MSEVDQKTSQDDLKQISDVQEICVVRVVVFIAISAGFSKPVKYRIKSLNFFSHKIRDDNNKTLKLEEKLILSFLSISFPPIILTVHSTICFPI